MMDTRRYEYLLESRDGKRKLVSELMLEWKMNGRFLVRPNGPDPLHQEATDKQARLWIQRYLVRKRSGDEPYRRKTLAENDVVMGRGGE